MNWPELQIKLDEIQEIAKREALASLMIIIQDMVARHLSELEKDGIRIPTIDQARKEVGYL